MKSSIFFIALASGLAAATPTGSSRQAEPVAADKTLSVLYLVLANSYKDAPGVSKRDLPADSIPVSVSEDVISSIKARGSAGHNPDLILAPVYLVGELQE